MKNRTIDSGRNFDWGKTSDDYARYREIYPAALFDRLAALGIGIFGQNVLDLGTGTGAIPRNMYNRGAKFTGIDISENQIFTARKLADEKGMDIRFAAVAAEEIDFAENEFDAATAGQCFIYFDQPRLWPKLSVVMKNGALFAIVSMNWLPEESEIAAESERIVRRHNPCWTGYGMRRSLAAQSDWLRASNFALTHREAFAVDIEFTRESWHGRMRACRGVGASLDGDELAAFEAEHMEMLQSCAPDRFVIPHYPTILIMKNRKGE
ncbi:MAG: class I SAM-dependent methyltransferase [Planctomycetes bacterium]|nr:class I SAM-dependent methyltransferase [Planctomycetota bacterium]